MQPCGAGQRSLGACSPACPLTPPLAQMAGKGTVQTHEGSDRGCLALSSLL